MKNVLTIALKEFRTFFQTPIGYVILVLFTFLTGWLFFYEQQFFLGVRAQCFCLDEEPCHLLFEV